MNENENNFESLRRLLALKRHEAPPPGYFNDFSSQVLQRIHLGQAENPDDLSEELFSHAPWLAKLAHLFDARPVFTGGFAGALCLLLLFGIVYAERPDFTPAADSPGRKQHRFAGRRIARRAATAGRSTGNCVQYQSRAQPSADSFALRAAKSARPAGQLFTFRQYNPA